MKKKQKPSYKRSIGRKIINTFIGFFGILVFVIILSFGIMQTSTFRSWLKNRIIYTVDSSINGTINISKIQGTILTSLYLSNVLLTTGRDTLFTAEKVGLNMNPFRVLIGQIYIGNLLLKNSKIELKELSNGKWNFENIAKSGNTPIKKTAAENKQKSSFPFNLVLKNLVINNLHFSKKKLEYQGTNRNYNTMNFNDIVVKNFKLNAAIAADINKKDFVFYIKSMSGLPNLNNFKLKDISGLFEVSPKFVKVKNLNIVTDSSSVNLTARLDSLNIFSPIKLKNFKNYPVNISMLANPINVSDITSFITSTDILNGSLKAKIKGNGVFGDINIKSFYADMLNTHLEFSGHIKKLNTPAKLIITAKISNSFAEYKDVLSLLPTLDLPRFQNFKMSNFNVLFNGEPTKFNVSGSTHVDSGKIDFNTFLNIQPKAMVYNAKVKVANLNVEPIIGNSTKINGNFFIKGKGISPKYLNTKLKLNIKKSLFKNDVIDSVNVSGNAVANIINLNLNGAINHSFIKMNGKLDFSNLKNPLYDFTSRLNNLNLMPFTNNAKYKSNLNLNFDAKGKYLDIDKTIGEFKIKLDSSVFGADSIYGSSLRLELKKDSTTRLINFYSNFADIYVNGEFKITDLINLLSYQSDILTKIMRQKVSEFNPKSMPKDSVIVLDSIPSIVNKNINLDYSLNFKDFSLIQILMQNDKLNILGSIQGSVQNDSNHFEISSELNLDKFVKIKGNDLMFLSGINADVNISRDNRVNSFKNIIGAVTFEGKRIYIGSDFHNINMDLTFNDSLLFYYMSTAFSKNLSANIGGTVELRKHKQSITVDTAEVNYKNIPWVNNGKIVFNVKRDSLLLNNFNLYFQKSNISLSGLISDSTQNLSLKVKKLPLNILYYYITGISDDSLQASINLVSDIKGTFQNPVINLSMQTDKILLGDINVGSFVCNLNYLNKNLTAGLQYNSQLGNNLPLVSLEGQIPVNLSFEPVGERAPWGKQIDLHLKSNNLDLKYFKNILPFISEQSGKVRTDISVTGTIDDPLVNGKISLSNGRAKVRATNLIYDINGGIKINNSNISITHFTVKNSGNSKYKGKLSASGNIKLKNHKLNKLNFKINGSLAILSDKSKSVSSTLFGDLFIGTNGPLKLTYSAEDSRYLISGDIKLKHVNLTYSSPHSGFVSGKNRFNYIYVIDSSKIDSRELDFMKLLSKIQKRKNSKSNQQSVEDNFDYKIKLSTENDAVFTLNLAKELGQKLTAYLSGSIVIDKNKEQSNAQGSFQLLDGSRLEFFKTLAATGEVRFEKKLLDPFIDVTASYLGDYVSPSDPFGKSQEVAVKIRLNAPLSQLGKELSLSDENFAVYVGRKDIDANIPNTNYDISDALAFILIGKFKKDLTANTKVSTAGTNSTSNAASYVISPILSGLLNTALGGSVVEDIQVSQTGRYYHVGISGKVQNFRYRIGGSTESLSDIAKANILIQYFINKNFSIRLERRYPIIYSEGTDERVNEFGLRYKFEF